jgi:hypothetical protein
MTKRVKRFSRGLNSFLYRPGYGFPRNEKTKIAARYQEDDPERYHIRGLVSGGFEVLDRVTGKPVSQMDSRLEAEEWVTAMAKPPLQKEG